MRLRSLFPPHQLHCSPPSPAQLSFSRWETGGASDCQLADTTPEHCFILHHQLIFPCLSRIIPKIGQLSVSSAAFNKQAPHKVACSLKRCEQGLPPQLHQFRGAHALTPGPAGCSAAKAAGSYQAGEDRMVSAALKEEKELLLCLCWHSAGLQGVVTEENSLSFLLFC